MHINAYQYPNRWCYSDTFRPGLACSLRKVRSILKSKTVFINTIQGVSVSCTKINQSRCAALIWYLQLTSKQWLLLNISLWNCMNLYILSKEEGKNQDRYNQIPHPTQETIWESDKNTKQHHMQERQEVRPSQQMTTRQQGTDMTAWQTWSTNNIKDSQKKHRFGTVSKRKILEGCLNMFDGANITLICDVDQDK